jgi:F-type H+-transporting ATPase subunit b
MQTEHWAGQIVWLLIIFGVLFLLLGKMFAPRLRKVIDARSSTIAEDLANARAIRDEAEAQAKQASTETMAAQAQARKMATDARSKAQAELTAAQAAEDIRLNALLAESEARIRGARDSALAHVSDIASETASALVEKLTGKPPTTAALKAALKKG